MQFALGGPSTLLIDTNLLLVLLVGAQDRQQIPRFKRTSTYTPEDYDLLTDYVSGFRDLVVTPNVLTEVSNLAGQLSEPFRSRVFAGLAAFTSQASERYIPSARVVQERDFLRLGLTDVSVVLAAGENFSVLTDDLALYLKLLSQDIHVVNFNHVRTAMM